MTTEILGLCIIIGALIVVALRWQMKAKEQEEVADLETSAEKIRYKMEHSADEIIARMTTHMDRLETLVALADERAARLEAQIKEMKAEAEANKKEQQRLQEQSVPEGRILDYDSIERIGAVERVPQVERTDANEFSQLLDASMRDVQPLPGGFYDEEPLAVQEQQVQYVQPQQVYTPVQEEYVAEAEDYRSQDELERMEESLRQNTVSPAVQARRLLEQGYATEEVARQLHMGRGAVELIRGMLEGKHD